MPKIASWKTCKNILCIRTDYMGDVLLMSPAFRAIKESLPEVRLTLFASSHGAPISRFIPEIDHTISSQLPWVKNSQTIDDPNVIFHLISLLRTESFDGAIIFTTIGQSAFPAAFLAYLAGIPRRLGYSHENPYLLLTDWVPDPEPQKFIRHEVVRQLDLVRTIGCKTDNQHLSLHLPNSAKQRVKQVLGRIGVKSDIPWIVMHPGGSEPLRRYPKELFASAIKKLSAAFGVQIILTGNENEWELCEDIIDLLETPVVYSAAGKLSLTEMAMLIHMSPLLISNNTLPVHIASAVNTPVVVLYAKTNPQHTPWLVKNEVLYFDVPCKACQRGVCAVDHRAEDKQPHVPSPDAIVEAVKKIRFQQSYVSL